MELVNNIADYFKEEHLLSTLVDDYTYRPYQAELAENIYKVFKDKEFLVAEAGTGIGKSYAYLVPAVLWAHDEGEKVVISTKTKALQQQLVEKDLPNITKALNKNIRIVEAKGRDNYLCWYKYMQILAGRRPLNQTESNFVEKILNWAERTKTGDRKELDLKSEVMSNWWIVAADRKSCAKDACPYQEKCFRLKMIRSLDKADIIIVNHALLLSDIVVENSILPKYKYLIIDEAHHIDKEAFTRLSNQVNFNELQEILKGLNTSKPYKKGYLQRFKKEMPEEIDVIDECITITERTKLLITEFQATIKNSLKYNNELFATVITSDMVENKFDSIYDIYFELIELLNRLINLLNSLKVEEADFIMLFSILVEICDSLFKIMEEDLTSTDSLAWIEWQKGEVEALASSIVTIGSILNEQLYKKLESLVMLSATITVDNKFDFFINKSGLNSIESCDRLNTFMGESPFSYEKQAKMLVIKDLPPPDNKQFTHETSLILQEIINITRGQTLILFTARKQMLDCAKFLRPFCEENGINLLVQNEDGEATNIVNMFIANKDTVLLGLDSFWEGIDLKGDILTCLVIVKLPFRAPNDPFSSANDKYYTNQGLNTFMNFALPDAVMRFKQGIGRLIRSEKDHGVVIVLDNRLFTKRYGESFRQSIPIKNVHSIEKNLLPSLLE